MREEIIRKNGYFYFYFIIDFFYFSQPKKIFVSWSWDKCLIRGNEINKKRKPLRLSRARLNGP